jgi:hypothetical protein
LVTENIPAGKKAIGCPARVIGLVNSTPAETSCAGSTS